MLKFSLPEPALPAGTYTGYANLLRGTENVPMTLTVRHSACWAVLTLLTGLLTAAFIAWLGNRWVPTAEWRTEIGRLLASAPQNCSPPVTTPSTHYDVLTAYTGQLRTLDHKLRREAWRVHAWLDPLGLAPQLTKLRQELEQLAQTPQAWQAFVQSLTELATSHGPYQRPT